MRIQDAIYARATSQSAITDLIGTRIYPGSAPQTAALPYTTYHIITGRVVDASAEPTVTRNDRIQLDHIALNYDSVSAIADAFRDAFNGWSDPGGAVAISSCRLIEGGEQDDDETPIVGMDDWIYRRIQEFTVWYSLYQSSPA